MKNKEELFIERINRKHRGAYRELFQEFYPALVMFAMKYLGKREEAEDVVQDVFVTIWEKQERFHSYRAFRVFLYNAVRNTCLNHIKHRNVEEKYAAYYLTQDASAETMDFDMAEEELYRQLFKTIDELPARCREIFLLHLDGKKNEEIAEELHLAVHTVKTQKKRALHYLHQHLGSFGLLLLFMLHR